MSKRDEDSQADMEVGMTTAERRRKRRRGGSLRVPSDNVPRSRPPTAPPAPRPEDPSLAMSIAYSFSNDGSQPVPRMLDDADADSGPIAPEAASTVIDPPANDGVDFDMKTREMSAVDLEALGLNDLNPATTLRMERMSAPGPDMEAPRPARGAGVAVRTPTRPSSDVDVDISVDGDSVDTAEQPSVISSASEERIPRANRLDDSGVTVNFTSKPTRERLQTVALSDADLEELRVRRADSTPLPASSSPPTTTLPPPVTPKPITKPPPIAAARTSSGAIPMERASELNKTQQLQAVDIEVLASESQPILAIEPSVVVKSASEPMSVPEIDLNELSDLADRASSSGEIDVTVDDSEPHEKRAPIPDAPRPPVVPRAQTAPPVAPVGENTKPKIVLPDGQHAHPPPPPVPPKAPPPKPAVAKPPPAVVTAKEPGGKAARGKPWFVDLFDEDYLRTLPFLTPQATQSEAEFVIEAMNLAPGAQVLDVGCGYGRHAMELAARGFHVVGLDLSTPLLVRGGEEAHRRGLTINFIRGDMRELDFENQFDAAYSLFSTFGYFDDETNKKTLQNIARALKPNGKVLIEILNRDYVIADLPTRVWWEGDGCVVLEEVELNYFSSRIQVNRSVVFDDGRQLEQEISVRAYSLHEVGKLMHAAGFRVLEVSGGYQMKGRFFGNQSRHIIVLAERKETPAP